MRKIIKWIEETSVTKFAFVWFLIIVAAGIIFKALLYALDVKDIEIGQQTADLIASRKTVSYIITAVIFAPLVETIIFQALFFAIHKKYNIKKWSITAISALIFGALHYYSAFYIIYGMILGVLFMTGYFLRAKNDVNPFMSIVLSHCLLNVYGITMRYFLS